MLTAVSLFSGCGGSDIGMMNAGIEPIYALDIDKFSTEAYKEITNHPVIVNKDIADVKSFPKADILAGCYPCQGYSQAGRRNSRDNINFLYQHYDRALREIKPLAFIAENVNGMTFSQNRHLLNNQLIRFRLAGYRVTHQVVNARDYGLAQDRKRVIIVGIRSDLGKTFRFPRPTHGIGEDLLPFKTLKDAIWKYRNAPIGSYNTDPYHWYYLSRNRRRDWNQQSTTIVANWRHIGLHPDSPELVKTGPDKWVFKSDGYSRRLSYFECAALQGFDEPEMFSFGPVKERFKVIGNAVPPPLFQAIAAAVREQLSC